MSKLIYLDNSATSFPKPEVVYEFMDEFYRTKGVSPGRSGFDDAIETDKAFDLLDQIAKEYQLPYRSMGMSDDYEIAIKHHATHLRIGRKFKDLL